MPRGSGRRSPTVPILAAFAFVPCVPSADLFGRRNGGMKPLGAPMQLQNLLSYASDFEDTSNCEEAFCDAEWHLVEVPVTMLIEKAFGGGKVDDVSFWDWWRRCRNSSAEYLRPEQYDSDLLLKELRAGKPVRKPIVITLGGMFCGDGDEVEIADGYHRLVGSYLAGKETNPSAVGVFFDAQPTLAEEFRVPPHSRAMKDADHDSTVRHRLVP